MVSLCTLFNINLPNLMLEICKQIFKVIAKTFGLLIVVVVYMDTSQKSFKPVKRSSHFYQQKQATQRLSNCKNYGPP